jgi:RNA 3'-terminal phosphate cyclase (ATP)
MSTAVVELDGSYGEGGGQILRTSLALSLITKKAFHLRNIRANRSKPGLQPQHLMCVRAAAAIGQAQLRGASLGSSDLVFEPGDVVPGKYHFAIGTAGATALVLHTLYLPLAVCPEVPSEIVISGGTHVAHAPCYHFLETTWRAYMEVLGLKIKTRMIRPGFYPRGGGAIEAIIQPTPAVKGIKLKERGPVAKVTGLSAVCNLPADIAGRQAGRTIKRLKSCAFRFRKADIAEASWQGSPGTVLAVILDTAPAPTLFFALGERGKKAERVADEAVDQALDFLAADAPVDAHSGDQIVLPLALAKEPSSYVVSEVTTHLTTNIFVIRQFLDREIRCEGELGKPGTVYVGDGK